MKAYLNLVKALLIVAGSYITVAGILTISFKVGEAVVNKIRNMDLKKNIEKRTINGKDYKVVRCKCKVVDPAKKHA